MKEIHTYNIKRAVHYLDSLELSSDLKEMREALQKIRNTSQKERNNKELIDLWNNIEKVMPKPFPKYVTSGPGYSLKKKD